MIVVRVELHSAITGKVTEIAKMRISNDGTGNGPRGNYDVATLRKGDSDHSAPLRAGRVEGHARLSYHVWKLVARALAAVGFSG